MTPEQLVYDLLGKAIESVKKTEPVAASGDVLLELKQLNTTFVGPVNIQLKRGEILALFGLRGAGHHEVGRCIWGVEPKDSGEILIHGRPVKIKEPSDAIRNNIGFVSSTNVKRREWRQT